MPQFIVRVAIAQLDAAGIESASVADTYVPVQASDEAEACQRAVLWHGDNGVAVEDDDLLWVCKDEARHMQFRATKCIRITRDEMDTFLSITQGIANPLIIGQSKAA